MDQDPQLPFQIDLNAHLEKMDNTVFRKILKDPIHKSLLKTLVSKNVLVEEFKASTAAKDAETFANNYLDKLEQWLKDGICQEEYLSKLQDHVVKKKTEREKKVESISCWIKKIIEKKKRKAVEEIKEGYKKKIEKMVVRIEPNPELEDTLGKVKGILRDLGG